MFDEVTPQVNFPALEREIIAFWRDRDVFAQSVSKEAPNGRYIFYEGPPTANGKPGVHHVISRAFKDLFPRFKTMQGFRVGRKGGWDTHGLPVEIAIEKRLGFTSKQQIEAFGIAKFNSLCREYVFENIQDWNEMTERIGFWLDLDNAYVTYDNSYIESCWWVMKQMWLRGLLVEDFKTTWHSPSSNTTLASHEVSLGYREDVEDPSVYPKFPADLESLAARGLVAAAETRPVSFLAWTTTPWTLAANTGLAVNPDADYALVAAPARRGGDGEPELYILAESRVADVFADDPVAVVDTFLGERLEGSGYRPVLESAAVPGEAALAGWRVVLDEFVSLDDGTGLVHLAPAYGDLYLGRKHGLPTRFSVGLTGEVLPEVKPLDHPHEVGPYTGVWFKEADDAIAADLLDRGLLFAQGTVRHGYPFNWRDGTPLMNVAKKSWYVRTTALRDQLLVNNDAINWNPDHIRTGRFGKWLENNVDWALSRERFWGTPLPVWQSEDGEVVCVGSIAELEALSGRDLAELDLHRPYVDDITFDKDGKTFTRAPYTIDVWFESGAMPYAQWHYLGEASSEGERERFEANFPADYICEAIDQTRGWFYSLHAIATLLTDSGDDGELRHPGPLAQLSPDTSSFKNVIVLGHIVDKNGEKMSKSKGNVVDPWDVLNDQGADALRWHLYSSSPPEATRKFSQGLVEETLRDFLMTLWNSYSFFVMYANLDRPALDAEVPVAERPAVDRWLVAKTHGVIDFVTERLEDYDPTAASRAIRNFVVDELSNWYVRRNRRRFWKSGSDQDKAAAYQSLYGALVTVTKLMAPMAPFVSDTLYQNLVRSVDTAAPESVHLANWPEADRSLLDVELVRDMDAVIRLVELGRSARAAAAIKTRQPLPEVLVRVRSEDELAGVRALEDQLKEELNVKKVTFLEVTDTFVDYRIRPNLPRIGKRLGRLVPDLRQALASIDGGAVAANVRAGVDTTIELDGVDHSFEPEAFLLDVQSPAGYEAAENRGYLAALNTTIDDDLATEGLARDVVRVVQNARKNAGLEVSDHIVLALRAEGRLATAIEAFADDLASEVLADVLIAGPLEAASYREEVEVEGFDLLVELAKT